MFRACCKHLSNICVAAKNDSRCDTRNGGNGFRRPCCSCWERHPILQKEKLLKGRLRLCHRALWLLVLCHRRLYFAGLSQSCSLSSSTELNCNYFPTCSHAPYGWPLGCSGPTWRTRWRLTGAVLGCLDPFGLAAGGLFGAAPDPFLDRCSLGALALKAVLRIVGGWAPLFSLFLR
jgi:hypothetical protein